MISVYLEEKQENGRYKPAKGVPVINPAIVYKSLATALYRHSLNRHCNRIQVKKLEDDNLRFTITHSGGRYRSVYIVENIGW